MSVAVDQVAQMIEKAAPKAWAETWDNVGLLVGSGAAKVNKILLTLDGTPEVVREAVEMGAQLIVAHHPLIFEPLKNLRADNRAAEVPIRLLRQDIAYYAAHTNLDQSGLSSSRMIGQGLSLQEMEILAPTGKEGFYKLVVFVPPEAEEEVRKALAREGAGKYPADGEAGGGHYEECFFAAQGTGMFRALPGADPYIGAPGELTKTPEIRLESIVAEAAVGRVIRALRRAHPYEEPAYDIIPLHSLGQQRGYGVIGRLQTPLPLKELAAALAQLPFFQGQEREVRGAIRVAGNAERSVKKVAILNGGGGSFVRKALFKGAEVLLTGDVDHHAALEALAAGMAVVDMGHYYSETPMLHSLAAHLRQESALRQTEILLSEIKTYPWKH